MYTIILTKKEAVELYGSEKCKKHFAKYGKFTNKDLEISLLKEMRRYYDSVKVIKPEKGRSYVYELSCKKDVVTPKEDGRINNGAWSIPYTKILDIMVVSVLEQGLVAEAAQTLSKWAVDFGAITPAMYELLQSRYNEYLRSQYLQDLKENKIIFEGEDRILDDFTYVVKEITNQLAGTLNRMQKAGIIEYYPVYKGHVEETDETSNLHEDTVKQVLTLKRTLMEQYDVNDWYLSQFKYSPKTKEYNQAWSDGLAQLTDEKGEVLGLDYYYVVYAIILKARKKKIIRYLEKYNKEAIERFKQNEELFLSDNKNTYHKERHDYVVMEAKDKENKFLSKKTKTYILDENLQEVIGAETLSKTYYNERENFTFDEGYYALYFDRLYAERIKKLQEHYGYNF
ncbi:hypothetical protein [Bacillus sp. OK048]|uniref:hypothetical protein n=1 Tax=Bacillus sp. OK048 TaxID=1882761 RepID=UPI00088D8094|nr:hypothetical protein [Bacillus sp. OK048]SDM73090.1 hypothetical protein SAMN05443253_105134 [Bacillus sp. OK048]